MLILLAIGTDEGWFEAVAAAAAHTGAEVERCASVSDALTDVMNGLSPSLVLVEADPCTQRVSPALRVLRRRVKARFVVAFGPAHEHVAHALSGDALVPKNETVAALVRELRSVRLVP